MIGKATGSDVNVELTKQELPVCKFQVPFGINTSMDFITPIKSARDFFRWGRDFLGVTNRDLCIQI